MIVSEDSPKDPLIPKTYQGGESSHPPPPPPPPYSPITANPYENISNFPQPNLVATAPRQSPGVRFLKAFVVAVLIYFLACALTESIFGLKHPNRHRQVRIVSFFFYFSQQYNFIEGGYFRTNGTYRFPQHRLTAALVGQGGGWVTILTGPHTFPYMQQLRFICPPIRI
jgi:hypothetical protein